MSAAEPIVSTRELAYRVLARGMLYPTQEWFAGLPEWRNALAMIFANTAMPYAGVETALQGLPAEPSQANQELQIEYTRLFINAIPSVLAPPYASAYAGQGFLMDLAADQAMEFYRRAGLGFTFADHELPDHLAVELEFMAWLCREQRHHALACEFLDTHILAWVPTWQAQVQAHARLGFYRALSQLIRVWLESDHASGSPA